MADNAKKPRFFKRLGKYFRDVGSEMKKVTWPTWAQTWKNTLVVLATVAVFAVVVWVLDYALTTIRTLLINYL